jgi:hypothetical protein
LHEVVPQKQNFPGKARKSAGFYLWIKGLAAVFRPRLGRQAIGIPRRFQWKIAQNTPPIALTIRYPFVPGASGGFAEVWKPVWRHPLFLFRS